ncbi:MAG: DUF3472 domain-containing protein [Candidatus Delongbacteria bacterium]|nr:DUF3472 domain-containing protein [Candidatus Delongbacteria bacterium]MBN2836701.1 DUF3472 domain-containing protein [Candidatus Delongbacteria bacterium]
MRIIIIIVFIVNILNAQVDHTKAARSVHLVYETNESNAIYNEITPIKSQMGTYFCVIGFNHGYYGIQEREDGKWIIFSIWDPGTQDNPDEVEENSRVRLLYKNDDMVIGRFGNEGTGGQSFYKFDWNIGETYKFLVTSEIMDKRTAYTAHFFDNTKNEWIKLVTFDTITNGDNLKGIYSFVEDFRRNGKSIDESREAEYQNCFMRDFNGKWFGVSKAKFTADSNTWTNIDAGKRGSRFYLKTGGKISMTRELWSIIDIKPFTFGE